MSTLLKKFEAILAENKTAKKKGDKWVTADGKYIAGTSYADRMNAVMRKGFVEFLTHKGFILAFNPTNKEYINIQGRAMAIFGVGTKTHRGTIIKTVSQAKSASAAYADSVC